MKKVLLLTLCVLIALPSMALAAGSLKVSGQATVFGLFNAPVNVTTICWNECTGTGGNIGGASITGTKCVGVDPCGKFCFRLNCNAEVIRATTNMVGTGVYLGGVFNVCGMIHPDVKCGPNQDTSISGLLVDMGGTL